MKPPVLWHFAISHFTEKARWALDWKSIPHVRKLLFLEYPLRCAVRTGQMQLPVLFWEGETILDSTSIVAHLETAQPEPALYPADAKERRRALELEDFFDEELGPHIRAVIVNALFSAGRHATAEGFGMGQSEARKRLMRTAFPVFRLFYEYRHNMLSQRAIDVGNEKLVRAVERLEASIGSSGYLVGDRFSVADLTAASLLYPLAQPPEYPYPLPRVASQAISGRLAQFEGSRAQAWVRDMYERHRGVFCAADG